MVLYHRVERMMYPIECYSPGFIPPGREDDESYRECYSPGITMVLYHRVETMMYHIESVTVLVLLWFYTTG